MRRGSTVSESDLEAIQIEALASLTAEVRVLRQCIDDLRKSLEWALRNASLSPADAIMETISAPPYSPLLLIAGRCARDAQLFKADDNPPHGQAPSNNHSRRDEHGEPPRPGFLF
jgi:hypothetical protein